MEPIDDYVVINKKILEEVLQPFGYEFRDIWMETNCKPLKPIVEDAFDAARKVRHIQFPMDTGDAQFKNSKDYLTNLII